MRCRLGRHSLMIDLRCYKKSEGFYTKIDSSALIGVMDGLQLKHVKISSHKHSF